MEAKLQERREVLKAFYDEMTDYQLKDGTLDYGNQVGHLIVHRSINNDPAELYRILEKQVRNDLEKNSSLKILDAGCGYGGTSIYLAERFPQHSYRGLTLSPEQVKVGNAAILARNITSVELEIRDYNQFQDRESYDRIIAIESLGHSADMEYTLRQWTKALKLGGHLIIIEDFLSNDASNNDPHIKAWEDAWVNKYMRVKDWVELVKNLGYHILHKEDLFKAYGFPVQSEEVLLQKIEELKKNKMHQGYVGALELEWAYSHGMAEYNFFVLEKRGDPTI
eukprot:TRINITY_DN1910_c0_g1_i1.p1 TRINITY_DN1910_c0_g1~~TRINITY_DN1910_c0_g1_i1.p1  ORF type:complete len:295 (+),score=53.05 TRINITY_DN1910_c0_g1_i1:46-885(+)